MKETSSKEIGSRIKELIFKLELNQTSFAKTVGVSHTAIFKTVSGETQPRLVLIDAILTAFPNVNRAWLLEGKGEMFNDKPASVEDNTDNYLQTYLKQLEEKFEKLLNQKDKLIESQQYLIEHLSNQLGKSECDTETGVLEHPAMAELREEGLAQAA
jgi:transcriptional regulator with XRE-family HTH domain